MLGVNYQPLRSGRQHRVHNARASLLTLFHNMNTCSTGYYNERTALTKRSNASGLGQESLGKVCRAGS